MHVINRLHKFNYRSLKKQNELRKKKDITLKRTKITDFMSETAVQEEVEKYL